MIMGNEYKLSLSAQEIEEKLTSVPDWEQNDDAAVDYIQNRPFYEEVSLITLEATEMGETNSLGLIADETYEIVFTLEDGTTVTEEVTAEGMSDEEGIVGWEKIVTLSSGEESELVFELYDNCGIDMTEGRPMYIEGKAIYMLGNAQSAKLKASKVHKLDSKYLPDEVANAIKEMSNISEAQEEVLVELENKVKEIDSSVNYSSQSEKYPTVSAVQQYIKDNDNLIKKIDKGYSSSPIILSDDYNGPAGLDFFDIVNYEEGNMKYNNDGTIEPSNEYIGVSYSTRINEIIFNESGITVISKANYLGDTSNTVTYSIPNNPYNNTTTFAKVNNRYYFVIPSDETDDTGMLLSTLVYYDINSKTFTKVPEYRFPRLTNRAQFLYCNGYFYLFCGNIATTSGGSVKNSRIFRSKYTTNINEIENYETLKTRLIITDGGHLIYSIAVNDKIYCDSYCLDVSNPDCVNCVPSKITISETSAVMGDNIIDADYIYNTITEEVKQIDLYFGMLSGSTPYAMTYDNIYFLKGFSGSSGFAKIGRFVINDSALSANLSQIKTDYLESNPSSHSFIYNKPFYENKHIKTLALLSSGGRDLDTPYMDFDYYDTFNRSFLYTQNTSVISDERRFAIEFRYNHEEEDVYFKNDNTTYRMCIIPFLTNTTLIWDFEKPNKDFYSEEMGRTGKYSGNSYLFSGDISQDNGEDFCYMIVTKIVSKAPYNGLNKNCVYLCFDNKQLQEKYGVSITGTHSITDTIRRFSLYATETTSTLKTISPKYIPDYISKTEFLEFKNYVLGILEGLQ